MRTLHLVSHTHWDREWYLTFQQFRLKLVHLIDGLLEEMESGQQFRFFLLDGQTIILDDYLEMRPEREETVRNLVRNNRLIIGPWHILPDEFLVSPEATLRNLLQGERTCRRFGPKMRIGYIPDPFGHIGQMPQILRGFGMGAACFQRGLGDEPAELWWQAPDDSRVFTAYLRDGYSNAAGLPTADHARFVAEVRGLRDALLPHAAAPHLLLMHGTDHMEPPCDTPAAIAAARDHLDGDLLLHSNLTDYITAVQGALAGKYLPTLVGELRQSRRHPLLPGVLSTRIWIKQRNHTCETLLEKWAEPFSVLAGAVLQEIAPDGIPPALDRAQKDRLADPASLLEQTWRLLMQNHPHDSICGCSIDQVHDEMRVRFDQVEQAAEELARQNLAILAAAIDTRPSSRPGDQQPAQGSAIVVFNPLSYLRTDLVSAAVELLPGTAAFDLLDESGAPLPFQELGMDEHELFSFTIDAAAMRAALGSLREGRCFGSSFFDLQVRRVGSKVLVEAIVTGESGPDPHARAAQIDELETCLAEPAIASYQIRARRPDSVRIVFTAPDVPGLGYRTFHAWPRPAKGDAPPPARSLPAQSPRPLFQKKNTRLPGRIENDFLSAEAMPDGSLTLTEKASRTVYCSLNRFLDGGDCGDEYNYAPPVADRIVAARLVEAHIETGPAWQEMILHLEMDTPASLAPDRKSRGREVAGMQICSRLKLSRGVPRLDIHTEVDNQARDHRLRVHFAAPFAATEGWHDGHFEVVRRPVGVAEYDVTWIEQPRPEVPQRVFTSVNDWRHGLTIANRGLPEVEVVERKDGRAEIALTLLRCVGWLSRDDFSTRRGHAGPMLETPGAQMQGRQAFDYAVILHAGGWREAFEHAYAFDAPLRALATGWHSGPLPPAAPFVAVSPRTFVVSALKQTADRRGWLVRGYNLGNEDIYVTIKPWRPFRQVERADLSEQKIDDLAPEADGSVTLPARKHEILTVVFLP